MRIIPTAYDKICVLLSKYGYLPSNMSQNISGVYILDTSLSQLIHSIGEYNFLYYLWPIRALLLIRHHFLRKAMLILPNSPIQNSEKFQCLFFSSN